MTRVLMIQKAKDLARYRAGVCLTPIAVLGVAVIALVIFVAGKLGGGASVAATPIQD